MNGTLSRLRRLARGLRRTPLHPQWLLGHQEAVGRWLRLHGRGVVLDIGCADRWAAIWMDPGCTYLGLDYPATGGAWYGARPEVFADAGCLPFADASIDSVLLLDVLEHLPRPAAALAEIARVLRPGGQLLVVMPFLYPEHDAPRDFQRYTTFGLTAVLTEAGLSPERVTPLLHASASAGVLMNLALAGMLSESVARRHPALLLAPVLVATILAVNLFSWLGSKLLPDWHGFAAGYRIRAFRP